MWNCKNCGEQIDDEFTICWKCGADENGTIIEKFESAEESKDYDKIISEDGFVLANTSLEGFYPNIKILGLVCSECIIGTDLISKAFAGIVNIVGGTSESYGSYIKSSRIEVTENIIRQAKNAGANAIMGIKYDYESVGDGMMMTSVTGTAVIL